MKNNTCLEILDLSIFFKELLGCTDINNEAVEELSECAKVNTSLVKMWLCMNIYLYIIGYNDKISPGKYSFRPTLEVIYQIDS